MEAGMHRPKKLTFCRGLIKEENFDHVVLVWSLFVDGSSNANGSGAGLILTSPEGIDLEYALRFNFRASNNEAEYEALIVGLGLAMSMGAQQVQAHSDLQLVVNQVIGEYEAKDEKMMKYLGRVRHLLPKFKKVKIIRIPRSENARADSLARLVSASRAELKRTVPIEVLMEPSITEGDEVMEIDISSSWMDLIVHYLRTVELPQTREEARRMRYKAARYVLIQDVLYKRGFSLLFPSYVKLYVGGIPRAVTEQDIRSLFGKHGNIVEVVLIKDKRTGQQQECCFVKYSKLEEADRAIGALHNQHTFPGGMLPIKVKYADKERERFGGFGMHVYKLYVGCLNKQASQKEIEEDVYILRDELKQSRGCAFVQFSHRDMAVAAINALNGTYTMRGCDQPLIVRFADPKKPKTGESRGNSKFGGSGFGPCSQDSVVRPTPFVSEPMGRQILPNALHPITQSSQPEVVLPMANQLQHFASNVTGQSLQSIQQSPSQLCQMTSQWRENQPESSQSMGAVFKVQNQLDMIHLPVQIRELERSSLATPEKSSQPGSEPPTFPNTSVALEPLPSTISSAPAVPISTETADCLDCDWSEHICPDGYYYYYNCATCESRWEKPEEYTFYEQQLQKRKQSQLHPCQQLHLLSHPLVPSTQEVPQMQQELDHGHIQAATT